MKAHRFAGMAGAAVLVSILLGTQAVQAQVPYASRSAKRYVTTLARAMDECVPANQVTVVNPGAVGACPQTNSATDSLTGLLWGFLEISREGRATRIRLASRGFTPPKQAISVQLTLRTTNTAGAPTGSKTYQDTTIACGPFTQGSVCGHYFLTSGFGGIIGSQTVEECLAANNLPAALASGNIEIRDVAVINCDTGKPIALPGVVQK